MGAEGLSASLWRERRQLELLLFRLETQLLYLNAGHTEWLTFTSADLESVLQNLRFETLARNVEAAGAAAEWNVPGEATLPRLAAAAPEGILGELLTKQQQEMAGLLQRIESAREANAGALDSAIEGFARDADAAVNSPEPADELGYLAQQSAATRALELVDECSQPLVEEFLGLG